MLSINRNILLGLAVFTGAGICILIAIVILASID